MTEPVVIVGDVRDGLRSLREKSIQACVTSPPYWALRQYQTTPQVWGGDSTHAHVWGEALPERFQRYGMDATLSPKQASNGGTAAMVRGEKSNSSRGQSMGQYCACGAWLGELGAEPDPREFVAHLLEVFTEVWRVLRDDGVCVVNLADTYISDGDHGLRVKSLAGVPQRFQLAMMDAGWIWRSDCLWLKRNCMPSSVEDRPTTSHEYISIFTKSERYYWDRLAVLEAYSAATLPQKGKRYSGTARKDYSTNGVQNPSDTKRSILASLEKNAGRNLRTVWEINTGGEDLSGLGVEGVEHFASYPAELPRRCILAATSEAGCCSVCRTPYRRVAAPSPEYAALMGSNAGADADRYGEGYRKKSPAASLDYRTSGWEASCRCPTGEPVPCEVLDPFTGTGTTLAVAKRHGRTPRGCELNPDYARLAEARVKAETGLFDVAEAVVPVVSVSTPSLFDEAEAAPAPHSPPPPAPVPEVPEAAENAPNGAEDADAASSAPSLPWLTPPVRVFAVGAAVSWPGQDGKRCSGVVEACAGETLRLWCTLVEGKVAKRCDGSPRPGFAISFVDEWSEVEVME